MGNCTYCGKPAGFLKRSHKECKQRYNQGKSKVLSLLQNIVSEDVDIKTVIEEVRQVAKSSLIDDRNLKTLIINGWKRAVDKAFDDGILTEEEESRLSELKDHFSLSQEELDDDGTFSKLVKGAVLRDVMDGKLPERVKIDGTLPFNLQKKEKIIWVFQGVDYYEQKTRTHYVGGSRGVSIRIAKGVYYRVGAFKGQRVQTTETVHVDRGLLGVTNKHIYFSGSVRHFRIAYSKIVAFEPYSDGIGVQRDAQTAKPQTFVTGDGWFTYNLIVNLAQM